MIGARYSRKCEGCVSFLACPLALIIVSDIGWGFLSKGRVFLARRCGWDTVCFFGFWGTSGIMDDFVTGTVGCMKEGTSRSLEVVV
jgi:hypothetical protein